MVRTHDLSRRLNVCGNAWPQRLHGRWLALSLAILATYPAALILLGSRLGPGVSPDSVVYAQAAESFAETGKLVVFGEQMTLWPPGYPLLLGALVRLGFDLQTIVIAVNSVSGALAVVLTFLLAREALEPTANALVVAALVSVSVSTIRVGLMLWTEPPFTVLVLGSLLVLVRMARSQSVSPLSAAVLAILVSAACTVRFAGVALLPAIVVVTFVAARPGGRGRAIGVSVGVTAASSVGILAIGARNISLGAQPLGDRASSGFGIVQVAGTSLRQMGRMLLPDPEWPTAISQTEGVSRLPLSLVAIALGIGLTCLLLFGVWRALLDRASAVVPLVIFVAAWWGVLVYSQVTTGVDTASDRLILPALSPMLILLASSLCTLGKRAPRSSASEPSRGQRHSLRTSTATVVCLTLGLSLLLGLGSVRYSSTYGVEYNSLAIRKGGLFKALAALPHDAVIAANDPWRGYWASRVETASLYDSELVARLKSGEIRYLAFFSGIGDDRPLATLEAAGVHVIHLGDYNDGTLYQVSL